MAVYSDKESCLSRNDLSEYRKSLVVSLGFALSDYVKWRTKWKSLIANALNRGAQCKLTFPDYMNLALEAGISTPDQIGLRMDQYQMARIGDSGDYVLGNCRFVLASVNLQEKIDNGGVENSRAKISQALSGRTKDNDTSKARAAKKQTGRTKNTHAHLAVVAHKRSMDFCVTSPEGVTYEGRNLNQFCKDHELAASSMREVCRGERPDYKGWTGTYTSVWDGGKWKP